MNRKVGISLKDIYKWLIHSWKGVQHYEPLGKYKLGPQWDATTC